MKTTVEEINGQKYTVVWHSEDPYEQDFSESFFSEDMSLNLFYFYNGYDELDMYDHVATALPALPRNPESKHAALLYRYAAEGIYAVGVCDHGITRDFGTHHSWFRSGGIKQVIGATNVQGNEIEVAIEEK